jgi:hypothetical protein
VKDAGESLEELYNRVAGYEVVDHHGCSLCQYQSDANTISVDAELLKERTTLDIDNKSLVIYLKVSPPALPLNLHSSVGSFLFNPIARWPLHI